MPRSLWQGLLFGAVISIAGCNKHSEATEPMSTLPAFTLQGHEGQAFSDESMKGSVWVVNFIFTSCPSVCPKLTAAMKTLHGVFAKRAPEVRFLSITVDPDNDTPEVLKAYAQSHSALQDGWVFATGDARAVRKIVVKGFRLAMGDPTPVEGDGSRYDIAHASYFVLIDESLRIVGYYRTDPAGLRNLTTAALDLPH